MKICMLSGALFISEVIGCTKCGKKSLTDGQKQKTMETVTVCQERVKQLDEMKKTEGKYRFSVLLWIW